MHLHSVHSVINTKHQPSLHNFQFKSELKVASSGNANSILLIKNIFKILNLVFSLVKSSRISRNWNGKRFLVQSKSAAEH